VGKPTKQPILFLGYEKVYIMYELLLGR